jgi:FtsZ-binding cell division protein ZapB
LQNDKRKLQDDNEKLQDDKKKLQDVNEKLQDDNEKLQQTIEFQNKIIALLNIKDLSEEERNKKMKELKLRYNQK